MQLIDEIQIVPGFLPVDMSGGANDGDWVSLKNYDRCTIIFIADSGTAGDDPVLSLQQATDVSGTDAKDLEVIDTVFVKQGASLAAIGAFTKETQTAAASYTDDTSAEVEKVWVVEVQAPELDVANDFDCLRARVADVGGNAQLGTLIYVLSHPRHAADPMPSAISD